MISFLPCFRLSEDSGMVFWSESPMTSVSTYISPYSPSSVSPSGHGDPSPPPSKTPCLYMSIHCPENSFSLPLHWPNSIRFCLNAMSLWDLPECSQAKRVPPLCFHSNFCPLSLQLLPLGAVVYLPTCLPSLTRPWAMKSELLNHICFPVFQKQSWGWQMFVEWLSGNEEAQKSFRVSLLRSPPPPTNCLRMILHKLSGGNVSWQCGRVPCAQQFI